MQEQLLNILAEVIPNIDVENSEDWFEDGLDSMGLMVIITKIHRKIGISLNPEDITADNFSNMDKLLEVLKKYC